MGLYSQSFRCYYFTMPSIWEHLPLLNSWIISCNLYAVVRRHSRIALSLFLSVSLPLSLLSLSPSLPHMTYRYAPVEYFWLDIHPYSRCSTNHACGAYVDIRLLYNYLGYNVLGQTKDFLLLFAFPYLYEERERHCDCIDNYSMVLYIV